MTVSHLQYNLTLVDASTSFSKHKKNPNHKIEYDPADPMFQQLIQSVALGTKATFSYNPTEIEIKEYLAQ